MPKENLPPPPPTFLLVTYPVIVSSIYLASCFFKVTDSGFYSFCSPPAKVFGLQPQRFGSSSFRLVLFCSTQQKYSPDQDLVSQLSWKKIKRKRLVASLRTQPYNNLVRDGRNTRNFEVVVAKIYGEVTLPRHWPRTPQTDSRRRCILDVRNRVLLVFIWLRHAIPHVLL